MRGCNGTALAASRGARHSRHRGCLPEDLSACLTGFSQGLSIASHDAGCSDQGLTKWSSQRSPASSASAKLRLFSLV